MKELLFSFLITKYFGQNETLFYLPKKVEIIVEIPCGIINIFGKYPLLSMFKNKTEIKIENLPHLIINRNIDSNIQIVCNYLKLLNAGQLSEKDLIIQDISMSAKDIKETFDSSCFENETTIEAKSFSAEECESLIKNLFKNDFGIQFPSYYLINSFINVFAGQLKKFSMNFNLTAANLIQIGIALKNPNLKKLREIIIKSFIKNSIHFTKSAYDAIINDQLKVYKGFNNGIYDENEILEDAIKALEKREDIISIGKIDPPLLFFHERESQEFSIITNENPNSKEYNMFLELSKSFLLFQKIVFNGYGNDYHIKIPEQLKHYTKFTHNQFLEEIKQILSVTNPVYTEEKIEYKNDNLLNILKSIEEIVGDYVFTADNFLKMILILIRIRENVPIIMMGETGCGKAAIIRKLDELLNNGETTMHILNIHAGVTDEEIVNFLFEDKVIEGRKYESIIQEAAALSKKEQERRRYWYEK